MNQTLCASILQLYTLSIYRGFVQSHFDYCNAVWNSCSKSLLDKLKRLQNCAARVLTYSNYDADANELIKNLRMEKIILKHNIKFTKLKWFI